MNADSNDTVTARLRLATRPDHEAVDAAFDHLGLNTAGGYRDFLTAHARILPLAERIIAPQQLVPGWEGRTADLTADLAALGAEMPAEIDFVLPSGDAPRWGALYVVEGSRLGGAVLAKMVPEGLPAAYLGARHAPGAWRDILGRLDSADGGGQWRDDAVAGARAMFGAYLKAAATGR